MKIKICGIRREEDVCYVNEALPDFVGFVFAETRRQVTLEQAMHLKQRLKPEIQTVGVFVNAPLLQSVELAQKGVIDVIQLHGDETTDYICSLKSEIDIPILKAVRVKDTDTIRQADELPCEFLLLDAYSKGQYGGTGKSFSWELIPEQMKHSFFLAGGLTIENIPEAMDFAATRKKCIGLDVSGGVETNHIKDEKKIKQIVEFVRTAASR